MKTKSTKPINFNVKDIMISYTIKNTKDNGSVIAFISEGEIYHYINEVIRNAEPSTVIKVEIR